MPHFETNHLLNFGKLKAYLRLDAGVGKAIPPKPGAGPRKSKAQPSASRSPSSPSSGKRGPQEEGGIRRVQVGCGPHNIMDDWWNVDLRHFPGIDAVVDATKPWPYRGLEYVYGEHFLEHLTLDGAVRFLEHAGNSLDPGGRIRLSTPNLEWVLLTHYSPDGGADEARSGTMKMNRAFHGWGHQFLYTTEMLKYLLTELGFEDVRFCSYGESTVPALMELEKHGGYSLHRGSPSVVIVEATRGHRSIAASEELNSYLTREYLRYVSSKAH